MSQSTINFFQYCSSGPNFSNFVFEVQLKIIKGDGGGVIFRANTSSNSFYLFYVGRDGSYRLFLCNGRCDKTLLNSNSSAIKQGLNKTNLIDVIAQQSTIGLYVNHQLIDNVKDSTYSSGQIGFIAFPWYYPTEVEYSNVKVWAM